MQLTSGLVYNIHTIMYTMCPPGCYHNGFMGQELHASPHIEHTPILSYHIYPYMVMSYPYMDM